MRQMLMEIQKKEHTQQTRSRRFGIIEILGMIVMPLCSWCRLKSDTGLTMLQYRARKLKLKLHYEVRRTK